MKPLTCAIAALAIAGSLLVSAPAVSSGASVAGGASGCCKDAV